MRPHVGTLSHLIDNLKGKEAIIILIVIEQRMLQRKIILSTDKYIVNFSESVLYIVRNTSCYDFVVLVFYKQKAHKILTIRLDELAQKKISRPYINARASFSMYAGDDEAPPAFTEVPPCRRTIFAPTSEVSFIQGVSKNVIHLRSLFLQATFYLIN